MATRYLVATGAWTLANTAIWSAASGGAPGASVPTSADDVVMDAASGPVTVNNTAAGVPLNAKSVNCAGFTGSWLNAFVKVYGDFTLNSIMTFPSAFGVSINADCHITCAGHDLNYFDNPSTFAYTVNVMDSFKATATGVALFHGTFNANNHDITARSFSVTFGTLNMGAGTWTLGVAGTGNFSYQETVIDSLNANIVFNGLRLDAAHFADVLMNSGYIGNVSGVSQLVCDAFSYQGSFLQFVSGTSVLANSIEFINLTPDYLYILPQSSGSFTFSCTSNVDGTSLDLTNCVAAGGGTFTAFDSVDNGGNDGWIFADSIHSSVAWFPAVDEPTTYADIGKSVAWYSSVAIPILNPTYESPLETEDGHVITTEDGHPITIEPA